MIASVRRALSIISDCFRPSNRHAPPPPRSDPATTSEFLRKNRASYLPELRTEIIKRELVLLQLLELRLGFVLVTLDWTYSISEARAHTEDAFWPRDRDKTVRARRISSPTPQT